MASDVRLTAISRPVSRTGISPCRPTFSRIVERPCLPDPDTRRKNNRLLSHTKHLTIHNTLQTVACRWKILSQPVPCGQSRPDRSAGQRRTGTFLLPKIRTLPAYQIMWNNQNLYRHLQKIRRFRRAGEQGGIPEFRYRTVCHPVVLPGDRRIVTRRLPFRKRLFAGSARARRQSCRQTSA